MIKVKYILSFAAALVSAAAIFKILKKKLPEREYSRSDAVWVL